jgi:hypothetical protein
MNKGMVGACVNKLTTSSIRGRSVSLWGQCDHVDGIIDSM